MKKFVSIILSLLLILSLFIILSCKKEENTVQPSDSIEKVSTEKNIGEEVFNKQCIMCHHEGSKIQNITEPADIVTVIREPKGSMPRFDKEKISDQDAALLARFIFLSILAKE